MHIQNLKFTVGATITRFDTPQRWYYYPCPKFYRQVREAGPGWWCDSHGHLNTFPMSWYQI